MFGFSKKKEMTEEEAKRFIDSWRKEIEESQRKRKEALLIECGASKQDVLKIKSSLSLLPEEVLYTVYANAAVGAYMGELDEFSDKRDLMLTSSEWGNISNSIKLVLDKYRKHENKIKIMAGISIMAAISEIIEERENKNTLGGDDEDKPKT